VLSLAKLTWIKKGLFQTLSTRVIRLFRPENSSNGIYLKKQACS
jgi:hypothetical protein